VLWGDVIRIFWIDTKNREKRNLLTEEETVTPTPKKGRKKMERKKHIWFRGATKLEKKKKKNEKKGVGCQPNGREKGKTRGGSGRRGQTKTPRGEKNSVEAGPKRRGGSHGHLPFKKGGKKKGGACHRRSLYPRGGKRLVATCKGAGPQERRGRERCRVVNWKREKKKETVSW